MRTPPIALVASVAALVAAAVLIVSLAASQSGVRSNAAPGSRGAALLPRPAPPGTAARLAEGVHCRFDGSDDADTPTAAQRRRLAHFRPAAAVRCIESSHRYPDGVWSVGLRQVSTGALTELVGALGAPNGTMSRNTACLDYLDASPRVVLVNAAGHTLTPRWPRDGCGHLQPAGRAAVAALHWHTLSATKLYLTVPNDPVKRVCQPGWKDMLVLALAHPSSRTPTTGPGQTATTTVCLFRMTSDGFTGRFVGGRRFDARASATLNAGLASAGQGSACRLTSRFAVLHSGEALSYVEIGGCWRVLRPDNTIGRADPSVVRPFLTGA